MFINVFFINFARNAAEMQALKDSIDQVRTGLQPENLKTFQVK